MAKTLTCPGPFCLKFADDIPGSIVPLPGRRSLRGMAAEFYPAPAQRGGRVLACPTGSATANCAAVSADRFCRSVGWNGARSQSLQSEGRRVYLADVLCANSGV